MADDEVLIQRVYNVKVQGVADAQKDINALNKTIAQLDVAFQQAKEALQQKIQTGASSEEIANLTKQVQELQAQLKTLNVAKEASAKESALLAKADQLAADATLKNAKAQETEARTQKIRIETDIAQEKELDRKIALEEKEIQATQKQTEANQKLIGSIADVRNQRERLEKLQINSAPGATVQFNGETVNYEDIGTRIASLKEQEQALNEERIRGNAIVKESGGNYYALLAAQKEAFNAYKEADPLKLLPEEFERIRQAAISAAADVQAFNRSLSPDGTLVGEYKTGIINAFRNLGLGDVVEKQRTELTGQLNSLIQKTEQLAQQYKATSAAGGEGLEKIDQKLKETIELQTRVREQLGQINESFERSNTIGGQITEKIGAGFKNLGAEARNFVLYYYGFQQAIFGTVEIFKQSVEQFEKGEVAISQLTNATKNLGGTQSDLIVLGQQVDNLAEKFKSLNKNDLVAAQQKLVTYGKLTREQITQLLPTIIDFARNSGQEIEASTDIVIKALEGQARGLKAYGINIKDGADVTERFNLIQTQLASRVKGSAEIFEQTTTGQLADYKQAILDEEHELGEEFVPKLAAAAKDSIPFIKALGDTVIELIKIITAIPFSLVITGLIAWKVGWALYKNAVAEANITQDVNNQATLLGFLRHQAERIGLIQSTDANRLKTAAVNAQTAAQEKQAAADEANLVATRAIYKADIDAAEAQRLRTIATEAQTAATEAQVVADEAATEAEEALSTSAKFNPLGIILTGVLLLVPAIQALGNSFKKSSDQSETFAGKTKFASAAIQEQNRALAANKKIQDDVNAEVLKNTEATIDRVQELVTVLKDEKNTVDTRNIAYQELIKLSPDFQGVFDKEKLSVQNLDLATQNYIATLKNLATAKAIETLREKAELDKTQADLKVFNAEIAKQQEDKKNEQISKEADANAKFQVTGGTAEGIGGGASVISTAPTEQHAAADALTEALDEQKKANKASEDLDNFQSNAIKEAQKRVTDLTAQLKKLKAGTDAYKTAQSQLEDAQSTLSILLGQNDLKSNLGHDIVDTDAKPKKGPTVQEQLDDKLKQIQSDADGERAIIERNYLQGILDQKAYLQQINDNVTSAEQAKISLIQKYEKQYAKELKDSTGALNKEITDAQINIIKSQSDTNKKLFDLQLADLNKHLENITNSAKDKLATVNDNPQSTPLQKNIASEQYNSTIIAAQEGFYGALLALEDKYHQTSVSEEKKSNDEKIKAMHDLDTERDKDFSLEIEDLKTQGDKRIETIVQKYNQLKIAVLNSNKSSATKQAAISVLDQTQSIDVASQNVVNTTNVLKAIQGPGQALYQAGVLTSQEYFTALAAATAAAQQAKQDLLDAVNQARETLPGLQGALQKALGKSFEIKAGDSSDTIAKKQSDYALLGQTISDAYQFAQNAMQTYFDTEQQAIENSLRLRELQIDATTRVALGVAQSAAEQDTIQREAAAQKLQAEKEAFEKNKKLQKAQAEINLAMTLSNLAVTAASPGPLNIITSGTWGIIFYALQAAIAIGNYALNVSKINAAQFAEGGLAGSVAPAPVNLGAGRIDAAQNIPTQPNGDNVLATVGRHEVILNKDHQKRLGGAKTFAAIGVPGFATGGAVTPWNIQLGDNLLPPTNPQAFLSSNSISGNSAQQMEDLRQMVAATNNSVSKTNETLTNLKVHVVSQEVSKQQRKDSIAVQRGNL